MSAANRLAELINSPGSFTGTPGFQFALDQGLQAAQRSGSRMRNSGNVLAELTRLGTGYASQDYGNMVDRLGRIAGQDQQFQLGQEQNRNVANRNTNDFTLGLGQNANVSNRNANDFTLGTQRNANDLTLGQGQNQNTANRNWWDFNLGRERNATDRFNAEDTAASRRRQQALDWWNSFNSGG